ncbi:MAG: CopD family protein [Vicinamibacterales bacterium]
MWYVTSVWLHIIAASTWIGGMLFFVLVAVPAMRSKRGVYDARFLLDAGTRFRTVAWACFAVLLATGLYGLHLREVTLGSVFDPEWRRTLFATVLLAKLAMVVVVFVLSAVHDFAIGPRAAALLDERPDSADAQRLRRQASLIGRANVLLALAIVAAAIVLVRGGIW